MKHHQSEGGQGVSFCLPSAAFLLTLLSFTSIKPASVFVLYVATALTVSLQGFLHSLVYGWLRQNFRQEAVGKRPSLQHQRGLKAFYESLGAVP